MIDVKLNVFRVVLLCGTTKVYAPCQLIVSGTQMLNHWNIALFSARLSGLSAGPRWVPVLKPYAGSYL